MFSKNVKNVLFKQIMSASLSVCGLAKVSSTIMLTMCTCVHDRNSVKKRGGVEAVRGFC